MSPNPIRVGGAAPRTSPNRRIPRSQLVTLRGRSMDTDYTIFQLDLLSPSTEASLKLDACESGHFLSGKDLSSSLNAFAWGVRRGRRTERGRRGSGTRRRRQRGRADRTVWSRGRRRGFGLPFEGGIVPVLVGVVVVVVEPLACHHCTSRQPLAVDADGVLFSGIGIKPPLAIPAANPADATTLASVVRFVNRAGAVPRHESLCKPYLVRNLFRVSLRVVAG